MFNLPRRGWQYRLIPLGTRHKSPVIIQEIPCGFFPQFIPMVNGGNSEEATEQQSPQGSVSKPLPCLLPGLSRAGGAEPRHPLLRAIVQLVLTERGGSLRRASRSGRHPGAVIAPDACTRCAHRRAPISPPLSPAAPCGGSRCPHVCWSPPPLSRGIPWGENGAPQPAAVWEMQRAADTSSSLSRAAFIP